MKWLVLAIAGAIICTIGDHLHATQGVLAYPAIFFWDQAWWVAPLFAGASLASVAGAIPIVAGDRPDVRRLAADGIGFFAAYAYTSFADHARPNVTLAVLLIAFLVRVLAERTAPRLIAYCLAFGVIGAGFETALSATGAFHYLHPDFLGIPRWLPGIYLHAGLLVGSVSGLFRTR